MAKKSRALLLALTFNVVVFLALAFVFPMPLERIGCVLTSLGWACVVMQMRRYRVGNIAPDARAADASIDFYRSSLERERDFAAAWPWFLAAVPGPVAFVVGATQQYPRMERLAYVLFLPVLGVLVATSVVRQIARAHRYQREIGELAGLTREHA